MTATQAKTGVEVERLPELPEPNCWIDWHGSSVAGDGGGWMQCARGFGTAVFTGKQVRKFAASQTEPLLGLLAELKWRIEDIRDGLMGGGNGSSIYGIDEWSTPAVNLKRAADLIETADVGNQAASLAAERAEVERLMGDLRSSDEHRLELQKANLLLADEVDKMREDAERFRWLAGGKSIHGGWMGSAPFVMSPNRSRLYAIHALRDEALRIEVDVDIYDNKADELHKANELVERGLLPDGVRRDTCDERYTDALYKLAQQELGWSDERAKACDEQLDPRNQEAPLSPSQQGE